LSLRTRWFDSWQRYIAISGEPHAIALGTSLGIFMAVLPLVPVRTVVIIVFCFVSRVNVLAAIITASFVANPLFLAFWYYAAAMIGNAITPLSLDWLKFESIIKTVRSDAGFEFKLEALLGFGIDTLTLLFAGGLTMAVPLSIVAYFLTFHLFSRKRNK
jgi:uncharacterized protein (DUF2062 family)